jgi:hypothetical protein
MSVKTRPTKIVVCKFIAELPMDLWLCQISKDYPDTLFEITEHMEWAPGKTIANLRIHSNRPVKWAEELRKSDAVYQVQKVSEGGGFSVLHVVHKTTIFVELWRQTHVMQRFPIRVRDGGSTWVVVGTEANIEDLLEELRSHSIKAEFWYRNTSELGSASKAGSSARPGPPRQAGDAATSHLRVCRLRIPLPEETWGYVVSKRHPSTTFEVVSYSWRGREVITDVRILSSERVPWAEELRAVSSVFTVNELYASGEETGLRIAYEPYSLLVGIRELHLLLRTPFTIRDGMMVLVAAGPEGSIKQYIDAMRYELVNITVEAVLQTEGGRRALLTPRQYELFHKSVEKGYFDVPRRISLTALAAELGRAPSSLSEILAVIEKKLVKQFETGSLQ